MVAAEDKGGSAPPPPALSNASLFERACRVTPGGVNSPVRAFKAVGGRPTSSPGARAPTWLM